MIKLEKLSFAYQESKPVLKELNLTVGKGQIVALVGSSGGGKSTIIKLLLGFYTPGSGRLSINGKGLDNYILEELRQIMTYVPQDAYLFDGTIDKDIFSFAGIWEKWVDTSTGEVIKMYSILITEANPLMEKIHSTKKRMPVILPRDKELDWIKNEMINQEILELTKPLDKELMEAYMISKLITSRTANRNVPSIQESYDYSELSEVKGA